MAYLWLRQLLGQMLPELENLPAGPNGETKARAWFERLLARFVERGLTTPAQQKNRVVDARNAIRLRFGDDHPSLAYVGFDEKTWQKINLPAHDRTEARNENQRLLRQPEKIVARAARLLESARFEDLAVGLGLTTGRRMSELLDGHARFKPATAWSVLFTGQRKHKGDREDFCFEIPTLAPAEKVLTAWERLLVMLGDEVLDPQTINNRYGHQVNAAADRHFRGLIPPRLPKAGKGKEGGAEEGQAEDRKGDALYLHLFRAVYATIAVHWFCPPKVNRLTFKAEIQGHRRVLDAPTRAMRRSYTAARHYDDYQIADASGKNLDGRQGIKLGKWPGLEVLGAFRDGSRPKVTKETPPPAPTKVTPIPVAPAPPPQEEAAPAPPALPSLGSPPAAVVPPATAPSTHPDTPMPTAPTPDYPAGSTPASDSTPTQEHAGSEVPKVPKEKKPRPVTYRIYPADRPRLDAFRTDPKQTQADNLQGVIDLLENASAAIRDRDQVQAQLQEAQARAEQAAKEAEQMATERDLARREAQAAAGRLQTQEGELRRLQQALEAAQDQINAASQTKAVGGGSPVALAVLARELLGLATEGECPAGLQGRLISLATHTLGVSSSPDPEKRQDAVAGAVATQGQAGDSRKTAKANRAAGGEGKFFGPLFATGGGARPTAAAHPLPPASTDTGHPDGQDAPHGARDATQAGSTPVAAGGDLPDAAEQPAAGDVQEPAEEREVNKTGVAPRSFTRRGGAAEKLERALQAVLAHNDAQTSREKKWAVTESALARLTGCFRPAVRAFFAAKTQEIEEHNQRHHLLPGMNAARGKRGEQIEKEVHWRGEKGGAAEGGEDGTPHDEDQDQIQVAGETQGGAGS